MKIQKTKREAFISMVLAVVLLLATLMAGCGNPAEIVQTASSSMESAAPVTSQGNAEKQIILPIVQDKITLNFAATKMPQNIVPMSEMDSVIFFEEKTNIHIEWDEIPQNVWNEKTMLMLSSNQLPDAFFGAPIDSSVIFNFGSQGMLISLENLIQEHSVNIKKHLEQRPDIKTLLTYPDGHIYSLPAVNESTYNLLGGFIFMNKTWLDKLSLKIPETTDEFYQVLKTCKENDANGNGAKDEIGLSVEYKNLFDILGAFGVILTQGATGNYIMIEDGKILYSPLKQGFRDGIEYLNKLYKDGLLDPESFTQNVNQLKAKGNSPEGIGSSIAFWQQAFAEGEKQKEYVRILPLKGPDGTQMWRNASPLGLVMQNRFTITSQNKYPEATLKWIDYIMDNGEVSTIMRYGPKNIAWKDSETEPGKWELILNLPDGTPIDNKVNSKNCHTNGAVWWWFEDTAVKNRIFDPDLIERNQGVEEYLKFGQKETWPPIVLKEDVQKEYASIAADLQKYVDSSFANFVFEGVTDNTWNEYVEKCKALKVDRYIEILQEAYNDFKNK